MFKELAFSIPWAIVSAQVAFFIDLELEQVDVHAVFSIEELAGDDVSVVGEGTLRMRP